jgi:hypothetical protein
MNQSFFDIATKSIGYLKDMQRPTCVKIVAVSVGISAWFLLCAKIAKQDSKCIAELKKEDKSLDAVWTMVGNPFSINVCVDHKKRNNGVGFDIPKNVIASTAFYLTLRPFCKLTLIQTDELPSSS